MSRCLPPWPGLLAALLVGGGAAAEGATLSYQFVGSAAYHAAARTINTEEPLVGGCGQSNSGATCHLRPEQQCCSYEIAPGDGGKTVTITIEAVRGEAMFIQWEGICAQPPVPCTPDPVTPELWCQGGQDYRGYSPDRLRGGGFQCTVTLPSFGNLDVVTRWDQWTTGFPDRTCNQFEALAGTCVGVPPPPPGTTTTLPDRPSTTTTTVPSQIDPCDFIPNFFKDMSQQFKDRIEQFRAGLENLRKSITIPVLVPECPGKLKATATVSASAASAPLAGAAARARAANGTLQLIAKGKATFRRPGAATIKLRLTRAGRRLVADEVALRLVFEASVKTKGTRATQTGEALLPAR